jgi:outer membrane protein assembly factor BamB
VAWQGFGGGPRHTWSRTGAAAVADELTAVWETEVGDLPFLGARVGGRLYVSGLSQVVALDAESGEPAWTLDGPEGAETGVSVVDGTAYVALGRRLRAVDAATGDRQWEFAPEGSGPDLNEPAVKGGTVYVYGEQLHALDAERGERRWRYEPAETEGTSIPTVAGGRVYVGPTGEALVGVGVESGEREWRFERPGATLFTAAAGDGRLYAGERVGSEAAPRLRAIGTDGAEVVWERRIDGSAGFVSTPAVGDGQVYATARTGDDRRTVAAFEAATGEVAWTAALGRQGGFPVVFGDTVYASTGNELVGFAAGDGSRTLEIPVAAGDGFVGWPLVGDGRLYVTVGRAVRAYEPG